MACSQLTLENSDNFLGLVRETHCNAGPNPRSIAFPPRSPQVLQKIWFGPQAFFLCSTNENTIASVNVLATSILVNSKQCINEVAIE